MTHPGGEAAVSCGKAAGGFCPGGVCGAGCPVWTLEWGQGSSPGRLCAVGSMLLLAVAAPLTVVRGVLLFPNQNPDCVHPSAHYLSYFSQTPSEMATGK